LLYKCRDPACQAEDAAVAAGDAEVVEEAITVAGVAGTAHMAVLKTTSTLVPSL